MSSTDRSIATITLTLILLVWTGPGVVATGAEGHGSPPEPPEIPAKISAPTSAPSPWPVWVSADEAITEGRLKPELFADYHREQLLRRVQEARSVRARSKSGETPAPQAGVQADCATFTVSSGAGPYLEGEPIGLDSLFEWAEVVVHGRLSARREGFLGGFATSLYRLKVDEVIKAPADAVLGKSILFDYPLTSIAVDGELLCQRPPTYPKFPEPGRKALVFGQRILTQAPSLIRAGGSLVVFEDAHGEVVLPWLDGDVVSGPPWEHIIQQLHEIAQTP